VESGTSCCIEAHGRGDFDDANLERLASICSGETCAPDLYLSPAAALCSAQVRGLTSGIGWCGSTFELAGTAPAWTNRSTVVNECTDGREAGDVGYEVVQVDAQAGDFLDSWDEIGLAECPP
jgi:hypothetical protein